MKILQVLCLVLCVVVGVSGCTTTKSEREIPAEGVIARVLGEIPENMTLEMLPETSDTDIYEIDAHDGHLTLKASSQTALCYAFNRYLKKGCHSMVTWSGKHLQLPDVWPDFQERVESPYRLRYFLNVCTFGYTTPYWDWERWSQELDWMALHGVNMPLASVASEAIARRVWVRMGLSKEEADAFFTGAAHLPWHRMGNLNAFDGPLTEEWHNAQIALQHKILDRMRELGMEPVAPAFAGFVPQAFIERNPDIKCTQLEWGGFETKYNACVLAPDSPYFTKLGKMFIEEWEKEFGKAKYFLSDSFNEMRLPVDPEDKEAKLKILEDYGEAIYKSIQAGDRDAVWVTQGWTFGYQHDFWDEASMKALLRKVPDDKMIIIDLGNDYPKWVWHTEQTWKVQKGFYGKNWIFSYVPNFGGKVLPTGELEMYASSSVEALKSPYGRHLVGFGSAPEGLENNEVVYELLSDMGWRSEAIDIDEWLKEYCLARYGFADECMMQAWKLFRETIYSTFYSYPRYLWQSLKPDNRRVSRHDLNDKFAEGVRLFLSCREQGVASDLYRADAVELAALWLGEVADRHYKTAYEALQKGNRKVATQELAQTGEILQSVDTLLVSHPLHRLDRWMDYAARSSQDEVRQQQNCSNALRLITTWGGFQEDYAARFWSGLIRDYYIPRMKVFFEQGAEATDSWEEQRIRTPWKNSSVDWEHPVERAAELVEHTLNSIE